MSEIFELCFTITVGRPAEIDDAAALKAILQAYTEKPKSFFTTPDENENTLLGLCCETCKYASAFILLTIAPEAAAIEGPDGLMPLHWAAGSENLELVKTLYYAYPDAIHSGDGETPLLMAVTSENVDTVRFLLSKGAVVTDEVKRTVKWGTSVSPDSEQAITIQRLLDSYA